MSCLYPDEDLKLLGCADTLLVYRLFFGFLSREGPREREALDLTWPDIDLTHGAIRLDRNKTDDPRAWALDPGTVRALTAWKERTAGTTERVFELPSTSNLVRNLHAALRAAKVTRGELFERSAVRRPLRVHDLRATFVTIALAAGKSEAWVCDRTGHKSSLMLNLYHRQARTWRELNLGPLAPLDEAIPELRRPRTEVAVEQRIVKISSKGVEEPTCDNAIDCRVVLEKPSGPHRVRTGTARERPRVLSPPRLPIPPEGQRDRPRFVAFLDCAQALVHRFDQNDEARTRLGVVAQRGTPIPRGSARCGPCGVCEHILARAMPCCPTCSLWASWFPWP